MNSEDTVHANSAMWNSAGTVSSEQCQTNTHMQEQGEKRRVKKQRKKREKNRERGNEKKEVEQDRRENEKTQRTQKG